MSHTCFRDAYEGGERSGIKFDWVFILLLLDVYKSEKKHAATEHPKAAASRKTEERRGGSTV